MKRREVLLDLISQGWVLVPVEKQGKDERLDLTGDLAMYLQSFDKEIFLSIFDSHPDLNWAVELGYKSNLVVFDLDNPSRLLNSLLPRTLTALTARGLHFYFTSSLPLKTTVFDFGEMRGFNHRVMVPPSVHPSGVIYQFLNPHIGVARLPNNLLKILSSAPSKGVLALKMGEVKLADLIAQAATLRYQPNLEV